MRFHSSSEHLLYVCVRDTRTIQTVESVSQILILSGEIFSLALNENTSTITRRISTIYTYSCQLVGVEALQINCQLNVVRRFSACEEILCTKQGNQIKNEFEILFYTYETICGYFARVSFDLN